MGTFRVRRRRCYVLPGAGVVRAPTHFEDPRITFIHEAGGPLACQTVKSRVGSYYFSSFA